MSRDRRSLPLRRSGRRPAARMGLSCVLAVVLGGLVSAAAQPPASSDRPHVGAATLPIPEGARSVEVISPHAPVVSAPRRGATRRGTLALRARFAVVARAVGDGCSTGVYADLGQRTFVCEEYVRYVAEPPAASPVPVVRPGALLPQRHAFVRYDATPAYAQPADYFVGDYVETFGEGFGLVVVGDEVVDGIGFVRLARGGYVTDDAVRYARGSDFAGLDLAPDAPVDLAWVRVRDLPVAARPRGRAVRRLGRRDVVHVASVDQGYARLVDGGFVRADALARVTLAPPPEDLADAERWIDISIEQQVLVAYEGTRPVFATLVSTGADRPGSATPLGTFRVWAKLASSTMDDLERTDVRENYLIEGVPWVQYFDGSVALHAAFWHDDFGTRRSHGCVNLSPTDARRLYDFTRPVVPDGYEALIPFTDEPRTRIRVRP